MFPLAPPRTLLHGFHGELKGGYGRDGAGAEVALGAGAEADGPLVTHAGGDLPFERPEVFRVGVAHG